MAKATKAKSDSKHPVTHPVIFRDGNAETDFIMHSTMTSDEVEKVGKVDHYVIRVDVSSSSHPFYTGKQNILDTSGRVDKFRAKMEKAKAAQAKK